MQELEQRLDAIFAARDRENMQPTIDAYRQVLAEYPDEALVLYHVGGAHDTAGEEETAAGFYERALAAGLDGETLRKCFLQYGSTLRNLGRLEESERVFGVARERFPDSVSLGIFALLTLHAQGRHDAALASALELFADHLRTPELLRYEAAIRGNAAYLHEIDARRPDSPDHAA
ncbi:tetratricopeptide repeat protein [Arthrobacter sp. NPDC090010]|uniref:tetratricopeptide repeat protein n=1 Tax=Arthrobacter sp. NPDC090010 TaxID=3363942 RepID=UPI003806A4CF